MRHTTFRAASAVLLSLAATAASAFTPATYSAGFKLSPGALAVLATGHPGFDGDRTFAGHWTFGDHGIPDARTNTLDLAAFSTGPDGQGFIPTWGGYGHGENRGRGGMGPLSFGESHGFAHGGAGGDATGNHTDSSAFVFHDALGASVALTDLYAKANTQASWSRGFSLDPHASFTFSGQAAVSITGDEAPLDLGTRFSEHGDAWMTLSSMTFGDGLGRAATTLGASVWGANSGMADISYLMGADGRMSMTITNHSASALTGRINAGSYVDVSVPIPEPGTWLMLLAGAGLVGATARRRAARPDA